VMAGVPAIFEAMVASVLPGLTGGAPLLSETVHVARGEGDIAAPLAALTGRFPTLAFGSYPLVKDGRYATNLVVRGTDAEQLAAARDLLQRLADGNDDLS